MICPEPKSAPVLGGFWRNLTAMQVNTVAVCQTLVSCLHRLLLFFFWVGLKCVGSIIIQNCAKYAVCDPPKHRLAMQLAGLRDTQLFESNAFLFPSQIMCSSPSHLSVSRPAFAHCSVTAEENVWRWTACELSVFHNTKTRWEVESCWMWSCYDIHSVWLAWIIALMNYSLMQGLKSVLSTHLALLTHA